MKSISKIFYLGLLATVTAASSLGSDSKTLVNNLSARATMGKSNEYKSSDCSGAINYEHTGWGHKFASMDGTSHSVYITKDSTSPDVEWTAWSQKKSNAACGGEAYGTIPEGCVNLDSYFAGKRIVCVQQVPLPE